MATINDLINAACEIRDADQDRENTAMRVGSLLVDIIDYIGGFVSISTLQNILADYAALDSRGQVEWRQARVISLYSMGTEYDNVDGGDWTPESFPVGSVVYEKSGGSHRLRFKKTSDTTENYPCILNAIYINLHSLRLYTFSETEGMVELNTNAAGGGGTTVTITKGGGYVDIDIIDNTPRITLSTQSIAMSGNDKTATFKVSGVNLKGPISINGNNAYFSKSPRSISPVGGVVNDATVTVTFGGTNDDTDDLTVSSPGATAQTIHVAYTAVAGPNIIVSPASLSFKAATNQTQTKQVAVQGSLLTDDVEVTAGGAFQVSLQSGSGFANSVTIPKASALAGITVYVRYTAGSSATTGTLTLTSDGAADKTVDLAGAVSTLTVSPSSLSFSTDQGVAVTKTFTIQGSNLTNGVTLALTDANSVFSLSKNSLTKAEAEDGETITVTYNSSAAGNHSGSIEVNWDGTTQTISLSGTAAAATMSDAEGKFTKEINGKTIYFKRLKVNDEFTNNVGVYNSDYNTSSASSTLYSGAISIPATVACDGTTYNVTTIADYAFGSCTGLTSLTIAEGITTINTNAIRGCTNNSFTSLTIPNSVTSLGQNNLFQCSKLTNIVIGDGVTAIGNYFDTQGTISNIIIGSSVASIGQYSTIKMSDTGTVTIKRTTPPSINGVVFKTSGGSYPCNATLRVPLEAVNTYKTGALWGENGSGGANWHQFNPDNIVAISE